MGKLQIGKSFLYQIRINENMAVGLWIHGINRLIIKKLFLLFFLLNLFSCEKRLEYPHSNKNTVTDTLFDNIIKDDYRWLEDLSSIETNSWIDSQEDYYNAYFNPIEKSVDTIYKNMRKFEQFRWHEPVFQKGAYYFYRRKDPDRNAEIIIKKKHLDQKGEIIFDPEEELKKDESFLGFHDASNDGKHLAVLPNKGSSSWHTIRIKNIETGLYYKEEITGIQTIGPSGNVLWDKENKGFFYLQFDSPLEGKELSTTLSNARIMYHRLDTSPKQDILVFNQPNKPDNYFIPYLTNNKEHIVIKVINADKPGNDIYYKNVTNLNSSAIPLIGDNTARFTFEGSKEDNWFLSTNLNAPNKRVISINPFNTNLEKWKTIVEEGKHTMNTINMVGNTLVIKYVIDARQELHVTDLNGNVKGKIKLPKPGFITSYPDSDTNETYIGLVGPFFPVEIYKINSTDLSAKIIYEGFEENLNEKFELKQIFYHSKDGTKVPMYITHSKKLELNSNNKVLLFGYGAYGSIGFPWYSSQTLQWLEMGGVYAYANIRGGGEYGENWHKDGIKENKQNAFDDFNAAAQWLIDNNYTKAGMIAANGISASGSTALTSVMQHPELYGAALISVHTLDFTRFHLFTGGKTKINEFGNPNNKQELQYILKHSPYQNIDSTICLPPTIIQVGENDQTTVPSHGYKFIAKTQQNSDCKNPIILKISRGAGHGKGTSVEERNLTEAEELAFIFKHLNHK